MLATRRAFHQSGKARTAARADNHFTSERRRCETPRRSNAVACFSIGRRTDSVSSPPRFPPELSVSRVQVEQATLVDGVILLASGYLIALVGRILPLRFGGLDRSFLDPAPIRRRPGRRIARRK